MANRVKEITVQELKRYYDINKDFQLIDVREPYENEIATLNAQLIPVDKIPESVHKIEKEKLVVIHCRSGVRSANAIEYLQKNHNFTNLVNLRGGILAWADEIDPTIQKY
jgi:adenylyltransferase/sulfurtransferase